MLNTINLEKPMSLRKEKYINYQFKCVLIKPVFPMKILKIVKGALLCPV